MQLQLWARYTSSVIRQDAGIFDTLHFARDNNYAKSCDNRKYSTDISTTAAIPKLWTEAFEEWRMSNNGCSVSNNSNSPSQSSSSPGVNYFKFGKYALSIIAKYFDYLVPQLKAKVVK